MKRILSALVALLFVVLQAQSMSYEQARREAFFLTDKMAYELNLTQDQYDAAYEINLDYLMSVSTVDDVFSAYWTRRNLDMSYILLQWQWDAFRAATYFYRPLYWSDGFWHFAIYARYPRRNYFYFSRPTVYISYRGGHSWRSNGGRSYYHAHRDHFRKPAPRMNLFYNPFRDCSILASLKTSLTVFLESCVLILFCSSYPLTGNTRTSFN